MTAGSMDFEAIVVGGGPAGATAAHDLATAGRQVLLLDRAGRIKPCGGAIPPRAMEDFELPLDLLCARASAARMVAPSGKVVDMPTGGGFVGMVDRDQFDEWLRARAAASGATRIDGTFEGLDRDPDGTTIVRYRPADAPRGSAPVSVKTRAVIGADGANSAVARTAFAHQPPVKCVFAYHEVIRAPRELLGEYRADRCDVVYQGRYSPDFYAWVFPHGDTASIGVGSANKGFALREAVAELRAETGLDACETVRSEGAPIPLKPRKRWDNGRDVVLAGDAAGIVAPASGEGIFYAMTGGRLAAQAIDRFLASGNPRALAHARKVFMADHGRVFFILGMMQYFWYSSDKRRERFVTMCADPDVQELTWQAYMNKRLVRAKPAAHARIFFKDLGHLVSSLGR